MALDQGLTSRNICATQKTGRPGEISCWLRIPVCTITHGATTIECGICHYSQLGKVQLPNLWGAASGWGCWSFPVKEEWYESGLPACVHNWVQVSTIHMAAQETGSRGSPPPSCTQKAGLTWGASTKTGTPQGVDAQSWTWRWTVGYQCSSPAASFWWRRYWWNQPALLKDRYSCKSCFASDETCLWLAANNLSKSHICYAKLPQLFPCKHWTCEHERGVPLSWSKQTVFHSGVWAKASRRLSDGLPSFKNSIRWWWEPIMLLQLLDLLSVLVKPKLAASLGGLETWVSGITCRSYECQSLRHNHVWCFTTNARERCCSRHNWVKISCNCCKGEKSTSIQLHCPMWKSGCQDVDILGSRSPQLGQGNKWCCTGAICWRLVLPSPLPIICSRKGAHPWWEWSSMVHWWKSSIWCHGYGNWGCRNWNFHYWMVAKSGALPSAPFQGEWSFSFGPPFGSKGQNGDQDLHPLVQGSVNGSEDQQQLLQAAASCASWKHQSASMAKSFLIWCVPMVTPWETGDCGQLCLFPGGVGYVFWEVRWSHTSSVR